MDFAKLHENSPTVAQINIPLTAEQRRLFKHHCKRTGMDRQPQIINALKRLCNRF